MPKKKLTKAQVKRKLQTIKNAAYDLMLDRLGHGFASFAPTFKTMDSINTSMQRALSKLIK